MTVNLTTAEARRLGLDLTDARKAKVRTTGRVAKGQPYHTICRTCGEVFHTAASEDRHVQTGHNRYELVLGYTS